MAITLHTGLSIDNYKPEPYAILYWGIVGYINKLQGFDNLQTLCFCDPYAIEYFDLGFCEKLLLDIERISSLIKYKTLIPIPPKVIFAGGGEDFHIDENGYPFGWEGIGKFIFDLYTVIEIAKANKTGLVFIGD